MKRSGFLACLCLAVTLPGREPLAAGGAAADAAVGLTVSGRIVVANGAARPNMAALRALPRQGVITSTARTGGVSRFIGPRLADVLDAVDAEGTTLHARAGDDDTVGIPVADARRHDVILAIEQDGRPLPRDGMGPVRVVYPRVVYPRVVYPRVVYPRDDHPELERPEVRDRWIRQLAGIEVR